AAAVFDGDQEGAAVRTIEGTYRWPNFGHLRQLYRGAPRDQYVSRDILSRESKMAVQAFMKIVGLQGDGPEAKNSATALVDFSFSISVSPGRGALPSSQVDLGDLNVLKKVDRASPMLFAACGEGTLFPSVTVSVHEIGEPGEYFSATLTGVTII